MKWAAGILYDEGRCGSAGIYGVASREEAIAWLDKAFNPRNLYLAPSCWIKPLEPVFK